MGKYEYVTNDKRKNELLRGVDWYIYPVRVPVAVKEAAKERGLSVQDFIFKAVLKELEQDEQTKAVKEKQPSQSSIKGIGVGAEAR